MKHITILVLIVLMAWGCKKIDKLTHFYMEYTTNCVIDQTTVFGSPFDVLTNEIPTRNDSIFLAENTDKNHVSLTTLKNCNLSVENMDSIPSGYFQSIEIYLIRSDTEDELIAWNDQLNEDDYSPFPLTLTTDDLSKYLIDETTQYRIHGELSGQYAIKTRLSLHLQYFVNASITSK